MAIRSDGWRRVAAENAMIHVLTEDQVEHLCRCSAPSSPDSRCTIDASRSPRQYQDHRPPSIRDRSNAQRHAAVTFGLKLLRQSRPARRPLLLVVAAGAVDRVAAPLPLDRRALTDMAASCLHTSSNEAAAACLSRHEPRDHRSEQLASDSVPTSAPTLSSKPLNNPAWAYER